MLEVGYVARVASSSSIVRFQNYIPGQNHSFKFIIVVLKNAPGYNFKWV